MTDQKRADGVLDAQAETVEDDPRLVRLAKREALLAAGRDPYGQAFECTHHAAQLEQAYADLENGGSTEDEVQLGGRIMAIRNQGKLMFMVLREREGDIQLFCRVNTLGDEVFAEMKDLDVGDWIGVTGTMMRTKRGQLSVAVTSYVLLSKSIRPLPEKFHGLSDKETRYRQRYVDLVVNPHVKDAFVKRSQIIAACRAYMGKQGYLEVETPILQEIMGGANAKPFITHFNALDQECFLRIATELHLKRLLVGGMDRVYEIGRIFRNEGMDQTHNPEFTSMEAYCAFSDIEGMKRLCEGFIKAGCHAVCDSEQVVFQGVAIDLSGTWRSVPLSQLVSEHVGEAVDIDTPVEKLRELLDRYHLEWSGEWGAGKLLFTLYDELCESEIVDPTFVCDYPVEVSPLAKRKPSDPRLTDRFELVIAGHEYANAFSELNDPVDQEGRFAAQMEAKRQGDEEAMGYDLDYIRALEYGMPPAGGIGIGIDRMVMLLTDQPSIRDVLLFPHMRPEAFHDAVKAVAKTAEGEALEAGLTREQALDLLKEHNKDAFHIEHGQTVEGIMRYFAREFDPTNEDFWGIVGLLHDVDWEEFPTIEDHTIRGGEIITAAGGTDALVHAIQTHNSDMNEACPKPESQMEKVLFAIDELSGLIGAAVIMRPSKSVMDFSVKSLKKKFKDKGFAAGCNRDIIRTGAENLGWDLNELFERTIAAMQSFAPDKDTFKPAE